MAWVLDLDGVVWTGDEPIDGAADAVRQLQASGGDVLFVTNMSARTREGHERKLAAHGIDATGAVISSAMAAGRLVEPGERVMALGGPGVVEALTERQVVLVDDGRIDAVVVGYHPDFDYAAMARAASAIRAGARFIGTNHDPTLPTAEGLLPGNGAILAGIETASGEAPQLAGKPHRPIAELVQERVGSTGTVVGDRPDSDGALARALGFRFALVLSGVTGPHDDPDPAPDVVAASLAALVESLG